MTILICSVHRGGIGTVALEDPHGQGFAFGVGQQADDDLQLAPFAIAVVAKLTEFVALTFQITAGNVVEKQVRWLLSAAALILAIQGPLDFSLTCAQIVESGVEIILIEGI